MLIIHKLLLCNFFILYLILAIKLFAFNFNRPRASLVALLVNNPQAMQETWAWSLGWEDPLEKGKATHSSILAWRIQVAKSGTRLSNYHFPSQAQRLWSFAKKDMYTGAQLGLCLEQDFISSMGLQGKNERSANGNSGNRALNYWHVVSIVLIYYFVYFSENFHGQ